MPGFVLTAYAGTGKDTFYREVATNKLHWTDVASDPETVRWVVCAEPGRKLAEPGRTLAEPGRTLADLEVLNRLRPAGRPVRDMRQAAPRARRYAFADALKEDTHRWLGFRDCPAYAFEAVKDTLTARDPDTGEPATLRQHYIRRGQEARRRDPLVWARIVATQIEENRMVDYPGPPLIDITTDWRFANELEPRVARAFGPTTIRLYREEVKVAAPTADPATDSEHNLDAVRTDFLLFPPGQFEAALQAFPQYAGYRPIGLAVRVAKNEPGSD